MKKSRFREEPIIGILKEQQAGRPGAEICRRHGISDATSLTWRLRFGGMEVSDGRRLKAFDAENRKLKKLVAAAMLDVATLREALEKPSGARRTAVSWAIKAKGSTQRRACGLIGSDPRRSVADRRQRLPPSQEPRRAHPERVCDPVPAEPERIPVLNAGEHGARSGSAHRCDTKRARTTSNSARNMSSECAFSGHSPNIPLPIGQTDARPQQVERPCLSVQR